MNNKEYDDNLLDEYLLGRLDEAARLQVEERVARDPAFAAEMEMRRIVIEGITRAGEENLRGKIAEIDRSLAEKGFFHAAEPGLKATRGGARFQRYRWLWAASVVLLLSLGFWLFTHNRSAYPGETALSPPPGHSRDTAAGPNAPLPAPPASGEASPVTAKRFAALAQAAYDSAPPNFSNVRNADDSISAFGRASQAFQDRDYQKVLHVLDTIPATAPGYWQAAEIRAHALFRSNQVGKAAGLFRRVAESGQLPFSERAEWFLLVCYAHDYPRQKANFKSLSAKILADRGHPYYEQTKNLVARVNAAAR